jgi:NAD+ kinase|tara:strand:- start:7 stop:876 length:870 start_codon:yes stop_codon:yes gene_type:complete
MKIAIFGQFYKTDPKHVSKLISILEKKNLSIFIEKNYLEKLYDLPNSIKTFSNLDNSFDLLISIGGDGTILKAITYVKDLNIPIVGLNTGRLGFLAKIQFDKLEEFIDTIVSGDYSVSERSLIEVYTSTENKDLKSLNFALNEISVGRKNTTSMIFIETKLDGKYLNSYWADGLIIATPTGSTGYSLSCGGPIIMPEAENLVITPIAPHNLNARPLVIADNTEISLKIDGRENEFLISLDSRITTLNKNTTVKIKKSSFNIKMIEFESESFLYTLREKLMWGKDRRNSQ